ncbi:MAG: dimethyl sulfoxide reductase anchor subunit, partial [Desulfovibrionales bacterium]|nr:dimethyl sulfoxide reductase anchor subunit [Desulfovibrionales bacterium]
LFTTLGQTGAGLALFAGLHALAAGEDSPLKPGRYLLLAALLMGAGFGFAALHLGSPDRMFNSMARLGSSALSQEGLAGMLAAVSCFVAGISGVRGRVNPALAGVAMALSLFFVFTMGRVYTSMATVPTWSSSATHVSFFGAALFAGASLFMTLGKSRVRPPVIWGLILGAALLVSVLPIQLQSAVGRVDSLGPLNCLAACSGICIALGLGGGIWGGQRPALGPAALGLTLVGILLGRTLFYGLHTTLIMY